MADGAFTLAAADWSKDQTFPASIVKLEIRENTGASDQYQELGSVSDMTLSNEAAFQTAAGGREIQVGHNFTIEGFIVTASANMKTMLANIASYIVDIRATDINGHTRTLSSTTGIQLDMVVGEVIESSDDISGSVRIPVRIKGFMTMALWASTFATS